MLAKRHFNALRALPLALALPALAACSTGKDIWSEVKANVGPPRLAADGGDTSSRQADAKPAKTQRTVVAGGGVSLPAYTACNACLIDADGKVVPQSTSLQGDLESATQDGDVLLFSGWGADSAVEGPARTALVVSNGVVVASASLEKPRPDISAQIKLYKNIYFGFEARVPMSKVGPTAQIWLVGGDGKVAAIDKVLRR